MIIGILVLIAIILISAMIVVTVFSSTIDTIRKTYFEYVESQSDRETTYNTDDANIASQRGTNSCDLEISFTGYINDENPFSYTGEGITDDLKFLVIGDNSDIRIGINPTDDRGVYYTWHCPTNTFNFDNLKYALLLGDETSNAETIRLKWILESTITGKRAFDSDGIGLNKPFQASTKLGIGTSFPINFEISLLLRDITHDHYEITWWSDQYKTNDELVGYRFTDNVCKRGFVTC